MLVRLLILALLLGLAFAKESSAQSKRGGGMEEFEEVDPYTKGDRELEARLGYVFVGAFPWHGLHRTDDVQETMGGIPMLWIETAHFRIGSSLGTYEVPNDREERARLKGELARLKKKLKKLKAPKKEIDPWLRMHLYAQRAEELYARFVNDFGLAQADYAETGAHLGNPKKFLLLLCERKSEFSRYVSTYLSADAKFSYRWGWQDDCMFFGINIEAIRETWVTPDEEPFDTMLYCHMIAGLAANFVDGFQGNLYTAPRWIGYALGHVYVRRIDPRWVPSAGRKEGAGRRDDEWEWEPRVRKLVKNEFFTKTEDMFTMEYGDMNARDHMVAWSRLDYLMRVAKGDRKSFLSALCRPPRIRATNDDAKKAQSKERQARALMAYFELTPSELDKAWAKWVERTYPK